MDRKGILVIVLFFVSVFFVQESFSQAAYQKIQSDIINVNPRTPTNFDTGRNFVDNTSKNKKVKAKIKLIHGSYCPSFKCYTSKARDKRRKMLKRKRR